MNFTGKIYISEDCYIDVDNAEVRVEGKNIHTLNKKEFALLKLFVENEGKILSNDIIIENVCGKVMLDDESYYNHQSVKDYIHKIRKINPAFQNSIKSERGLGYKFEILNKKNFNSDNCNQLIEKNESFNENIFIENKNTGEKIILSEYWWDKIKKMIIRSNVDE